MRGGLSEEVCGYNCVRVLVCSLVGLESEMILRQVFFVFVPFFLLPRQLCHFGRLRAVKVQNLPAKRVGFEVY